MTPYRLSRIDLAARLAHDEQMTLVRASQIHRVPLEIAIAAYAALYPRERRRSVP